MRCSRLVICCNNTKRLLAPIASEPTPRFGEGTRPCFTKKTTASHTIRSLPGDAQTGLRFRQVTSAESHGAWKRNYKPDSVRSESDRSGSLLVISPTGVLGKGPKHPPRSPQHLLQSTFVKVTKLDQIEPQHAKPKKFRPFGSAGPNPRTRRVFHTVILFMLFSCA